MNKLDWEIIHLTGKIKEWSARPKVDIVDRMIIAHDQWLLDIFKEYKELKERYAPALQNSQCTCGSCGQTYFTTNTKSKFCSDKCRVANHRKSKTIK